MPFSVPHVRVEGAEVEAHARIGWFRSVANIPHVFATQCFIDELAHRAGQDARQYALELVGPARKISPAALSDPWNYSESPQVYPIGTAEPVHQVSEQDARQHEAEREGGERGPPWRPSARREQERDEAGHRTEPQAGQRKASPGTQTARSTAANGGGERMDGCTEVRGQTSSSASSGNPRVAQAIPPNPWPPNKNVPAGAPAAKAAYMAVPIQAITSCP